MSTGWNPAEAARLVAEARSSAARTRAILCVPNAVDLGEQLADQLEAAALEIERAQAVSAASQRIAGRIAKIGRGGLDVADDVIAERDALVVALRAIYPVYRAARAAYAAAEHAPCEVYDAACRAVDDAIEDAAITPEIAASLTRAGMEPT